MSKEDLDLETLAAFLDGRLDARDRERVLTILGESDLAYDLFVETLRLREALDRDAGGARGPSGGVAAAAPTSGSITDAGSAPSPRWAVRSMPRWAAAAAAAVLVGVIAVNGLRSPSTFDGSVDSLDRIALAEGLPTSWDVQPWTVVRGNATGRFDPEDVAFRMGVRSVDLALALTLGQNETAQFLAAELESLAGEVDLGQPLVLRYRQVAAATRDGSPSAVEAAARAHAELTTYLDADRVRLGQWTELGRIAAVAGDRSYLQGLGQASPPVADVASLPPGAVEALADLERALGSGTGSIDLAAVATAFEALTVSLGR